MKIVKYIVNALISFLIIFVVFAIIATNILNNKILNKDYMLSKLEETEFYLQISREIENGFENYIYQSGLPEDTIKNLFSDEIIRNDVRSLVNHIYDGSEIVLSSEEVRNNLDAKIQEYVKNQNLNLNEQGKKNINEFENLIVKEYDNNINVSSTLYEKANSGIEILQKISVKIGNLPIIILIILIVILIIINIKELLLAINFLGISSLSIGILLKLGVNLIFSNVQIDDLLLISSSLSNLIINIIKEILYMISDYSNVFIVSGITAILAYAILNNIKSEKSIIKPKRRKQ